MISQLSIYTENRKGAMNRITGLLHEAGINISGFVTNDSAEFGTVRMLVSDIAAAADVMQQNGYLIKKTPVIAVEISDEVGSLDKLLDYITRANININYLYATFDRIGAGPIIVIRSDDLPELESYLRGRGYVTR